MLEKTHFEEVSIEKLRWRCNPDDLNMETTDDLTAVRGYTWSGKGCQSHQTRSGHKKFRIQYIRDRGFRDRQSHLRV